MRPRGELGEVGDAAEDVGILDDDAARLAVDHGEQAGDVRSPARGPARAVSSTSPVKRAMVFADRDIMGVKAGREDRLAAAGDPPRHRDRLPAGGRAVIHRGVGDVAAVEPRDLGLELEQGLQRALGDLGLVGRVAGQELAALDEMIDAGRDVVAIGAAAEEEGHLAGDHVAPGKAAQMPLDRQLAGMVGQAFDLARQPRGLGHVDEQIVDRGGADGAEHLAAGRHRREEDNA